MASESPPPSSDDVNPASGSKLSQDRTAEGQALAEPPKEIPQQSVFVNSEPIREDQVQNAIKFLSHPRVKGSPIIHRRNFLERKGLTKEEIDEAFRRVPDSSSGATSSQATTSQVDGQVRPSSNIQQQGSAQTIHPAGGAPSGVISTFRRQFHWYHAFLAIGFIAASGVGTIVIFKNSIIPRLRSWIRKVISEDDNDGLNENDSKPSWNEEAAAAAKAAAAAAADAAKASQEMVIMKSEEKQFFERFMSLMDGQLQEIKSMKTVIVKLEGQSYNSGRAHQVEEEHLSGSSTHLRQPLTNGKTDYDSRSVRSLSPPGSSQPLHPKSYMEIMEMVRAGERPPNVRDINDAPPNPNQPISNPNVAPRTKPWEAVQPARTSNSYGSQPPYTGVGSSSVAQDRGTSYPFNNESSTPWWQQQKNVSITEIENEDDHQGTKANGDNIPINQPPQRKWVPPQPPPVVMAEAAVAIRQPKPKVPRGERSLDSSSSNGSEMDELQKVTRISELGGEPDMNGGPEIASSSEIQEEQVAD